jgi:hypothetical protein
MQNLILFGLFTGSTTLELSRAIYHKLPYPGLVGRFFVYLICCWDVVLDNGYAQ